MSGSSRSGWRGLVVGAALLVGLVGVAAAQDRPPKPSQPAPVVTPAPAAEPISGKVEVGMMVVHARTDTTKVDPALEPIMQNLKFLPFQGFSLLEQYTSSLGPEQETTWSAAGRRMKVELLSRDEKQARIRVVLLNGDKRVLDTTVSIHRNKSFMLAGPKHLEGVLVFALSVRY